MILEFMKSPSQIQTWELSAYRLVLKPWTWDWVNYPRESEQRGVEGGGFKSRKRGTKEGDWEEIVQEVGREPREKVCYFRRAACFVEQRTVNSLNHGSEVKWGVLLLIWQMRGDLGESSRSEQPGGLRNPWEMGRGKPLVWINHSRKCALKGKRVVGRSLGDTS